MSFFCAIFWICSFIVLYINKQQIDKQRGLNKHYYISQGQFSNIPGVEKWKEELLLEENSTDECVKKYAE